MYLLSGANQILDELRKRNYDDKNIKMGIQTYNKIIKDEY